MLFVQIAVLFLLFKCENEHLETNEWKCTDMDTALIEFKISDKIKRDIEIFYQYKICNKCDLLLFKKIFANNKNNLSAIIDSYYGYVFSVRSTFGKICDDFEYVKFGECGIYSMNIDMNGCNISLEKTPNRPNVWVILGGIIIAIFVVICILTEKYKTKIKEVINKLKRSSFVSNFEEINLDQVESQSSDKIDIKRIRSLDTFRGISLFLMIFVNYGSGGYKFMQHVPWHGLTIADFVVRFFYIFFKLIKITGKFSKFPWFLWIMGFTIPMNIFSQMKKNKKAVIFKKIFVRSIKMFFIGIMLNSRFGVELSKLRIFGVLQRIAICYFIVAILELVFYKKINLNSEKKDFKYYFYDLIWSKYHLIFIFFIILIWTLVTFLAKVPGCPRGYMGPGGLEQNGQYYNCTGGVAGFLDKKIIGESHLYKKPTSVKIYKTTEPFDPEGLFGIFNSVVLTYLGVHAGRTFMFYKSPKHRTINLIVWACICFVFYSALTQFDMSNGWIPVNKNLWTLTYSLITAFSSFIIYAFLYFIIDIKSFWSGNPFIFLGMNSIVIYVSHSLFSSTFPCQWIVSNNHLSKLLLNIWGSIFWTLISIYFYYKKWFINL